MFRGTLLASGRSVPLHEVQGRKFVNLKRIKVFIPTWTETPLFSTSDKTVEPVREPVTVHDFMSLLINIQHSVNTGCYREVGKQRQAQLFNIIQIMRYVSYLFINSIPLLSKIYYVNTCMTVFKKETFLVKKISRHLSKPCPELVYNSDKCTKQLSIHLAIYNFS